MKRITLIFVVALCCISVGAQSDYYMRQARSYQHEAEYYTSQAQGYDRETGYYNRQAQKYLRDAEFYSKHGKYDRVESCQHKAKDATERAKSFER